MGGILQELTNSWLSSTAKKESKQEPTLIEARPQKTNPKIIDREANADKWKGNGLRGLKVARSLLLIGVKMAINYLKGILNIPLN